MRSIRLSLGMIGALALAAAVGEAQQPTRRGQTSRTIEIRGQVPTPQVVTVRPREAPQFDRNVLVPDFYNPDFLGLAIVGYQLVPRSTITGSQTDTVLLADRKMTPPAVGVITTPEPLPQQPVAAAAPAAPADTSAEAARRAEIEAIRKELAARRARLDSIAGRVQSMGQPTTPRDTTRRP
jgi:hypothetical protein